MANRKISDLTALTAPASGDYLPIVDISEAAAADKNKRITVEELLRGAPNGAAGAPGIAFESDPNTGIYSPGADQVAISTNGTGRLFVDASGNVSISGEAFSVNGVGIGRGGGNVSTNTRVGDSALTSNTSGDFNTAVGVLALTSNTTGTSNTSIGRGAQYFNASGASNVAVGRDALQANTSGGSNTCIGTNAGKSIDGSNNTIIGTIQGTSGLSNTVIIGAGSTERLRIDSSGRLGLGTSSPNSALDVNGVITIRNSGTVRGLIGAVAGDANYVGLQNGALADSFANSAINQNTTGFTTVNSASGQSLALRIGNSTALHIDSSKNVGVGTTSPAKTFDCLGDVALSVATNGTRTLAFRNSTIGTDYATIQYADASGLLTIKDSYGITFNGASEWGRWDASGRLLVGISTARSNFFNTSTYSPGLQLEGVTDQNRFISIVGSNSAGAGGTLILASQTSGSIGGNAIVSNGGQLGVVSFHGNDGTEFVEAARIQVEVDGTPGANDMPGRLVFSTTADGASSPTERVRITNDGYFRLAGKGIQFNGDTADANSLDDYEEGTWTATIYDASSGGNASSTTATGYYTKIGRVVHCTIPVFGNLSTSGLTAGNQVFISAPFTATAPDCMGYVTWNDTTGLTAGDIVYPVINNTGSRFIMRVQKANTTFNSFFVSNLVSGASELLNLTVIYHA